MRFHHLTIASIGRLTLFDDENTRRYILHRVRAAIGRQLLLFSLVDDHLHLVIRGSRDDVGRMAQRVSLILRLLTRQPLQPSHIVPVGQRRHLERLVPYLLTQAPHHELPDHPALFEGSCFLDLVGARVLDLGSHWTPSTRGEALLRRGSMSLGGRPASGLKQEASLGGPTIFKELPRLRRSDLFAIVDIPRAPVTPDVSIFRELGFERLEAIAASSLAYGGVRERQPRVARRWRELLVYMARAVGFRVALISDALELSKRSVIRYSQSPNPCLQRGYDAVLQRLSIELEVERSNVRGE